MLSDAERFLVDWHDRRPGEAPRAFADALDERGRTSYDLLAELARPGDAALDLCCGDGALLELLLERGATQATGIDLSAGELQAARDRLGERARLHHGRAQELPFPDASFDLVTCHMALMLLDPVEPMISEALRVLRPGGRFGAVVGGPNPPDDPWEQLVARLRGFPFQGPSLGDRRARTAEGLASLLGGFDQVEVREIVLRVNGPPERMWRYFQTTYNPDLMSEEDVAVIEAFFRTEIAPRADASGRLPFSNGRRLVTGVKPGTA